MTAGPALLEHLIRNASRAPDRPAFLTCDGIVRYGEFLARIGRTASGLRARGIEPGDRVLLCAPNSPELASVYFAVHWLGAIAVPVEPGIPEASLRWISADCGSRLAIIDGRAAVDLPEVVSLNGIAASPVPGPPLDPLCEAEGVADILYTTGTTGARKGVALTHRNILSSAVNITAFLRNDDSDVEVLPLPLSHSFGLGRLRCMALNGNSVILERDLSNPAAVLKRLVDLRATGLALVPSGFEMLRRLTRDYIGRASACLRYIEIGSMPMRAETRDWLQQMLPNTRICHHYGLTEASRSAFTEYHSDSRPGTIGRAAPNVEITIRDKTLAMAPVRTPGEIVIRGEMVMRGYWNRPDLTSAALSESGLRTGDYGYMDEDGYVYLLGREDDLINVGGLKVVPDEIEEKIRQYDGVKDAACIGIPDPYGLSGQCVKAFIVADNQVSLAGLRAWLRGQLEEYKIPGIIENCAGIPRTNSGKPQRRKLRELEAAHGS